MMGKGNNLNLKNVWNTRVLLRFVRNSKAFPNFEQLKTSNQGWGGTHLTIGKAREQSECPWEQITKIDKVSILILEKIVTKNDHHC